MAKIESLKGIGKVRAEFFWERGIYNTEDLLYFFPRTFEDRTVILPINELCADILACVKVKVFSCVKEIRVRKNMVIYSMKVSDESGTMSIVWYNNRFIKGKFKIGEEYVFYGKVVRAGSSWEMQNPMFEKPDKKEITGKIMPIYSLGGNMTQKVIQGATGQCMEYIDKIKEYIPLAVREEYGLAEINFSLKNMHYPETLETQEIARYRFAFEELYLLQLALLSKKGMDIKVKKEPFADVDCRHEFIKHLPFKLTGAQMRVINEIAADFTSGRLMSRLVQGDVGSGKTAVAASAMYIAVKNGFQAAIMAPTEILAKQHFETFSEFFKDSGIRIVLLCGSTKKKEELYAFAESGEIDIIIGTHAVIQEKIKYKKLGMVVVDEQHRFGVGQRAALAEKGENPHVLVMTATPIPRTLALILYGDLDISVLDELPPGRKPVETFAVGENMRRRIYAFMGKNIQKGSQCYVVCPMIEETERSDLKNASDIYERLKLVFPMFSVGLVHGKMKATEKEEVMEQFASHKIDILVSTTVIEVGVNVPASNIMVIENAERFGLSQLHQLRGRVGRGAEQAYCILFSENKSDITKKRLDTMCKSNDGFYISEQDLKLRGPGDFFGTRQHGLPDLKVANLFKDIEILKDAQEAAKKTISGKFKFSENEAKILSEKIKGILADKLIIN